VCSRTLWQFILGLLRAALFKRTTVHKNVFYHTTAFDLLCYKNNSSWN